MALEVTSRRTSLSIRDGNGNYEYAADVELNGSGIITSGTVLVTMKKEDGTPGELQAQATVRYGLPQSYNGHIAAGAYAQEEQRMLVITEMVRGAAGYHAGEIHALLDAAEAQA